MDINDIGRALEVTNGAMCFHPTVHDQDFFAADNLGTLTEDYVRETVHNEFKEWGSTKRYAPKLHPNPAWYSRIIAEEFEKVRSELA